MKSIFVVGKNRSGTKWLSNIILNSDNVLGIQSEYHRGIFETNLFDVFPNMFGNLKFTDNYIAFVETFTKTDFFKATGLKKELLYRERKEDYFEIFHLIMGEFAKKNKKNIWLQKAHIVNLPTIYKYTKDDKFVIIERHLFDAINSSLKYQEKLKLKGSMLREVFLYIIARKLRRKYDKKNNIFFIKYEDLIYKNMNKIKKMFDFLGINFLERYLSVSFKKNTSFDKQERKELTFLNKTLAQIYYVFLSCIPLKLLLIFIKMYRRCFGNNKIITSTFSEIYLDRDFELFEY